MTRLSIPFVSAVQVKPIRNNPLVIWIGRAGHLVLRYRPEWLVGRSKNVKVLALETSSLYGGVALIEEQRLVAANPLPEGLRTAAGLAPAIRSSLDEADWRPEDIDLVAVTSGPGSFTGLRVGITTAKVFAYAAGCEVLPVNTLQAIAYGGFAHDAAVSQLSVVLNAQRNQLFEATFSRDNVASVSLADACRIVDIEDWISAVDSESNESGLAVCGAGLSVKLSKEDAKILRDRISRCLVLDESRWMPSAESVGRLAMEQHVAGKRGDVFGLKPNYFRLSAAEEKAQEDKAKLSADGAKSAARRKGS